MAESIFCTKPLIFTPSRTAPILVAACGNPDAADDAFGPTVIAALSAANASLAESASRDMHSPADEASAAHLSSPPCTQGGDTEGGDPPDLQISLPEQEADVEALNLGMNPASLLDHLPGREMLILLDAASSPESSAEPALIELHWPADRHVIESLQNPRSTHGFSIAQQLQIAESLGFLPQSVHLLLAPAKNVALGAHASYSISIMVTKALERIKVLSAFHHATR